MKTISSKLKYSSLPKDVLKRFKMNLCDSQGCECSFYLGKKLGYKFYYSKDEAEEAWLAQKTLYKFGLAPRTYGMFKIRVRDWRGTVYGFKTQIAKVLDREKLAKSSENYIVEKLIRKLRKAGFDQYTADIHIRNIGMIGRRLVLIDTGPASVVDGTSYSGDY